MKTLNQLLLIYKQERYEQNLKSNKGEIYCIELKG